VYSAHITARAVCEGVATWVDGLDMTADQSAATASAEVADHDSDEDDQDTDLRHAKPSTTRVRKQSFLWLPERDYLGLLIELHRLLERGYSPTQDIIEDVCVYAAFVDRAKFDSDAPISVAAPNRSVAQGAADHNVAHPFFQSMYYVLNLLAPRPSIKFFHRAAKVIYVCASKYRRQTIRASFMLLFALALLLRSTVA